MSQVELIASTHWQRTPRVISCTLRWVGHRWICFTPENDLVREQGGGGVWIWLCFLGFYTNHEISVSDLLLMCFSAIKWFVMLFSQPSRSYCVCPCVFFILHPGTVSVRTLQHCGGVCLCMCECGTGFFLCVPEWWWDDGDSSLICVYMRVRKWERGRERERERAVYNEPWQTYCFT